MLDPEVAEKRRLIHVTGDLLGAPLGGHVLGARERRPATLIRAAQQIAGDKRHRPARAFLPRCISG